MQPKPSEPSEFWLAIKTAMVVVGTIVGVVLVAPFIAKACSIFKAYWVWMDKFLGN